MGSKVQANKFLLDIEECVSDLKKQSEDGKVPINDDSTALHRLQEKLELILLFGLIEKPGLLGPKKSYWNYICACFSSSKRIHDGINFVKSVVALKTPLGRGRAFIRFCLTQKCLADTLQSCFMNQKISRDFYTERSLPLQERLWGTLVTSLYELNDLNFDLCAGHTELDISWPKFAWKLFSSLDNENFPHRNMSTPNLHTFISQDEFNNVKQSDSSSADICSSTSDNCSVILDAIKLAEINAELSQENEDLKKEVGSLEKEKLELQNNIQALQMECLSLQQKLSNSSKEHCEISSNEAQLLIKDTLDNFSSSEEANVESLQESTKSEISVDVSSNSQEMPLSATSDLSVKSKNKDINNFSDCALLDKNSKMPSDQILNSDMPKNESENSQINKNIARSPLYINELLMEIKTVIDDIEDTIQKSDVTLAIPHISHLKRIRNHLEDIFSSDVHKTKSYLNFSNFVENCVSCIKNFASKQENIINSLQEKVDLSIKGNHNLYSKIKTLKTLLKSYGFLRVTNEKEIEPDNVFLPDNCSSVVSKFSCEDFARDIAHDPMLKRIIVPLLPVLNLSFTKLNSLNEKMVELQFGLDTSQELNNHLINRVQDQEMHLKGVTKEIEEAQQLVSVLKKQHRKLQSAEGILKYDLQEKRKLLTRLKQQLENTREDFNQVRIKNSKSEAEWQDLHKEFAQRHKQTSEESGFVDDKAFDEHETASSSASCDYNYPEESTAEKDSISKDTTETPQLTKKRRLALLEEQCQTLYSSLLQSSKKRQEIDKRLENMCRTIEKNNEHIHLNSLVSSDLPIENNISDVNNGENHSEDNCQNIIFSNETFTNSPPTSDVGSLNSECSSCMPSICNDANSSDSSYCDSSKADSCISFSPCKLHIGAMQTLSADDQIKESNFLHNSSSVCSSDYKENDDIISSCASSELTINDSDLPSISHVDSILTKKKDLEESLKTLEIDAEIQSEENMSCSHSEELNEQICFLQSDNKKLLCKVQELEKRILILTTELDRVTQQLVLSKSAKEHEVAALQFQLNTEALNYEKALKEFSEQSKGLETMKLRVTEQEKLIFSLEETLTEIHSDREIENERRWQESMTEVEEEHSRNEVLLSQLEELKIYNLKDKENMESEILNLKHYSRELQKKLIKLLKEKDILWKRNDHLYHLQKVKIDDRWINDSEVSCCLACKNNFSLTLRKHHCRVCGRIFCYSCANNWLMTASSRKKIRSCNECFMQHMEIKKVVRRGSDVPHIDDDSEDDIKDNCDFSFLHASRSSFTSEIPSSMSNSIISLPITQNCNASRFASAPDLRYVYKPNEFAACSVSVAEDKLETEEEKLQVPNGDAHEILKHETVKNSSEFAAMQKNENVPKICRAEEISVDDLMKSNSSLNGKLVTLPGTSIHFPIFCQTCPVILKWTFESNGQTIPFTISYESQNCDKNSSLFYESSEKMQDEMELSLSGYYIFHFDNTIRDMDTEIKYVLTAMHPN